MGLFSRKSKSSSSYSPPSESSRPTQSSQPFNYAQYPDGLIPNPGGAPTHFSPSPPASNGYSLPPHSNSPYQSPPPVPQQQYYQATQQSAYHSNSYPTQPLQDYASPYQPTHSPAPVHQNPYQQTHQSSSHQQQVVVNILPNSQSSSASYQQRPQYRNQYPQSQQQQQQSQGIPRCEAGHPCERYSVKNTNPRNAGRLYWRCGPCNRFVVWDDER